MNTKFLTSIFLLTLTLSLKAQQSAARVEGRVTDAQQLALTQAAVSLENTQTNAARQTVSDEMGRYQFEAVAPGQYRLRVRRSGFAAGEKGPLEVKPAETTHVDV